MNIEKTIKNLEKHGFKVQYYDTAAEAAKAIAAQFTDKTIGIGGSMTIKDMGLYEMLNENNTVLWHWLDDSEETRRKAAQAEVFLTSANAISETGEIVNIDGTGNRVACNLYGPERVMIISGVNKIAEDLEKAVFRARNVASPLNAIRLNRRTPCAMTTPMRCHDCASPERICKGVSILLQKVGGIKQMDVVLIGETLGY